jgi:hypothetical protein
MELLLFWVELDPDDKDKYAVDIYIVGTGHPINFDTKYMESPEFLDTVIVGSLVWHIFFKKW